MSRMKILTGVLSVMAVCSLILGLVLLTKPAPAQAYARYTYKPGCHCGKPTATTVKKTTTTKKTTATTKKTTTTTKVAPTTTSLETTTTTTLVGIGGAASDLTYMWGAPDSQQNMDLARGIVAGLALSSGLQPPPSDPPSDGGSAGGSSDGALSSSETDAAAGMVDEAAATGLEDADAAGLMSIGPPQYYVGPAAVLFLIVYVVSFILYRTRVLRVATHRKIWNVLLMATFLTTAGLGLLLAAGISMDPPLVLPRWLLLWHVETGMVMSFISIFHLGWHLKYYLAIFTRRGKAKRAFAAQPERLDRRPAQAWAEPGQLVPVRAEEPEPRVGRSR